MPNILVIGGVFTGKAFALSTNEVTIGRDADNGIGIPDPALSRRHCAFTSEPAGWRVRDLGSSNGTFVNGVKVQSQLLAEGDHVTAGGSVLMYLNGSHENAALELEEQEEQSPPTAQLDPSKFNYLHREMRAGAERRNSDATLRVLLAISTRLNPIREEAELYRTLLELLFSAVPATEGAIVLPGSGTDLDVRAVRGAGAGEGESAHVSAAVVRRVMSEGVGLLWSEPVQPEDLSAGGAGRRRERSSMAVPIGVRGRSPAVIYLAGPRERMFTEEHLQVVTAAGQITATCLENVRQLLALERETDRLNADLYSVHQIVGESEPMQQVGRRISKIGRVATTVLITGESGTGKELAARAIHRTSSQGRGPFVAVNCAAIVDTLLESELFGHERGAFSGAIATKKGKMELAHGGTLFLDEVGELALPLQTKLLRVLQEREFERVGGTRPIKVDIRLISATNRDLAVEVANGRFRQDLYFRLNVISLHLPPLRERGSDLNTLAEHFVDVHRKKADRLIRGISPAALACMLAYEWPGNVRELENAIERAVVLGSGDEILPEDLPETLIDASSHAGGAPLVGDLHEQVLDVKRRAVLAAYRQAKGSYTDAAKLLGVHPNYLHRLIKNLGIKSTLEDSEL